MKQRKVFTIIIFLSLLVPKSVFTAEAPADNSSFWTKVVAGGLGFLVLYLGAKSEEMKQRYAESQKQLQSHYGEEIKKREDIIQQFRLVEAQNMLQPFQGFGKGAPKKPVIEKKVTFADYINVPEEAEELVEQLKNPGIYAKFGIKIPRGVLLTGDPGTGKTYLARAIAGELDFPYIAYAGPEFTKSILGASGEAVRAAFDSAKDNAKSQGKNIAIMFIDEFDVVGSRGAEKGSEDAQQLRAEIINSFLSELDGFTEDTIKVIVIAATNYPDRIDPALTRSGRLDKTIYISYPNEFARQRIIEQELKKTTINKNILGGLTDKLVKVTEGLSQADLAALFQNAGRVAIKQKKYDTGIDLDCFARVLWNMKEANRKKQLPAHTEKGTLVANFLRDFGVTGISREDLLSKMDGMTVMDIEELFNKAYEFSVNRQEKNLVEWLLIAINAKNQQIKIRRSQDVIHLCEKIYEPLKIEYENTNEALLQMQPDHIFKAFADKHGQNFIAEIPEILQEVD